MVVLGFPNPIKPTNSNNKVSYSELQVQDYDLSQIQANVSTFTRNLQNIMSQKDKYVMLAQNATTVSVDTTTTSIPLILDKVTQDENETYNLSSGVFTAPQSAVFMVFVNLVATPTVGAPTRLFLNILSSQDGTLISEVAIPVAGGFFLNSAIPFLLSAGSTLKFYLTTDIAIYTLNLYNVRLFVSWK